MKKTDIVSPTAIQAPFAINGDRNIPNYNASGTETSSIDLGFLPVTSQPLNDGGIAPERTDFNGMFYLSTDQRVYLQDGGLITYDDNVVSEIGGYPQDAILSYIDGDGNLGFVKSLIDDNANDFILNPALIDGTHWDYVHLINTDADITTLTNNINTLSSQCVKLTGSQTVAGSKTFTSAVRVPNSTASGTALALADRGSGYIKFGDGTIIQWGHEVMENNKNVMAVSMPISFPQEQYRVVFGDAGANNNALDVQKVYEYTSGKTFKVRSSGDAESFNWLAIGR